MPVYLTLIDINTGKECYREICPLPEFFRRAPVESIEEWIKHHGNAQHSSMSHTADLRLVSYRV